MDRDLAPNASPVLPTLSMTLLDRPLSVGRSLRKQPEVAIRSDDDLMKIASIPSSLLIV